MAEAAPNLNHESDQEMRVARRFRAVRDKHGLTAELGRVNFKNEKRR